MNMLAAVLPMVGFFLGIGVIFAVLHFYRWLRRRRPTRSPFTEDFLNPPGKSLRQQIDGQRIDLLADMFGAVTLPGFIIFQLLYQEVRGGAGMLSWVIHGIAGLGALGFFGYRLYRRLRRLSELELGYDAELYMGQCLEPLVGQGYRVFHDFPARNFNIDHIVVGPTGVYAVETKARRKPRMGRGARDARVTVESGKLHFPHRTEKQPMEQARSQAKWLSDRLARFLDRPLYVTPVLAIPGWYVEQKDEAKMLVFNGRNAEKHLPPRGRHRLEPEAVYRIVQFLDRECRYTPTSEVKENKRLGLEPEVS